MLEVNKVILNKGKWERKQRARNHKEHVQYRHTASLKSVHNQLQGKQEKGKANQQSSDCHVT